MTTTTPRLHIVTHDSLLAESACRDLCIDIITRFPAAVHLRARHLNAKTLFDIGTEVITRAGERTPGVLVINDRVDVARALDLKQVHLPESGLPAPRVREILGNDATIGRSVHTSQAAMQQSSGEVDYVFLGPVWPTRSHPGASGLGVQEITAARTARVIAIGGVNPDRARQAVSLGAFGVAVISYVWNDPDPSAAVERILLSLEESDD